MCINRITGFLLFILTSFAFLMISLLRIVDFEKICTVCIENRYFIDFSKFTGSKLNIQNGGLHCFNRCQNFDFQIALTFLFYIRL